jgi:hypothetical protein
MSELNRLRNSSIEPSFNLTACHVKPCTWRTAPFRTEGGTRGETMKKSILCVAFIEHGSHHVRGRHRIGRAASSRDEYAHTSFSSAVELRALLAAGGFRWRLGW